MKRLRWSAILTLAIACSSATTASAVHRTMLLETFTNVSCDPCADNDPIVRAFMTKYGPALAVGVQYHMYWPSPTDPFYLLTPNEARARKRYYSVRGVPENFADGIHAWADFDSLEVSASSRLQTESPFALAVQHTVVGSQVNVTVTVNAVDAPPAGTLALRVALVETEVHYPTAPGSNGEKDFYNSMRRMLPDTNGAALIITQGEERTFNFSTPVVAAWDTANIRAVAWIQKEETKEVLQAGSSVPPPEFASYFGTLEAPDIVSRGATRTFRSVLMNRGTSSDSYTISMADSLPAGWSASVRAGGVHYPPWTHQFPVLLNPGAVDTVLLNVTPMGAAGTGKVRLTATSVASPSTTWTRTFKVISSGLSVLLVDYDYYNAFETWYATALDSARCSYAIWDRVVDGPLSAAQLESFAVVVWDVDLVSPPFYTCDMNALGTYLDNGGRLFVSGQDVGWAMCDAASPDCTPQSQAWYSQYLGADYVQNEIDSLMVYGVAGDPIGNGLSFSLADGGIGSGWQYWLDEIEPRSGASAILYYSPGHEAGIRYEQGAYKVVYLAYGFQAQNSYASQQTLMLRSLQWLDCPGVADVSQDGTAPRMAFAPRAAPNPFGGATRISFVVGGSGAAPVSVVVYDVSGRRVRRLWEGLAPPGARSLVWDGRDDGGARAASGIYLARVCVGDERRTLKLALTE